MSARLTLISHAPTAAMRAGRFPDDDLLDERGRDDALAFGARLRLPSHGTAVCSPARCARETARLCGLRAEAEPALAEANYGAWRGRRMADIERETPGLIDAWMSDPFMSRHGGESWSDVCGRVGAWLDGLLADQDVVDVVAITHATVMRAALVHVLYADLKAMSRIELGPLARLELKRCARGWVWLPSDG